MSRGFKVLMAVTVGMVVIFIAAGTTGASVEPQVVRVTLDDNQIGLSPFTVVPGKAVNLVINNQGDMAHRLRVLPYVGGSESNTILGPVVAAHSAYAFQLTLAPGVYRIECTQTTHAERGMVNAIVAQTPLAAALPFDMRFALSMLGLVLGSAFLIIDSLGWRGNQMASR